MAYKTIFVIAFGFYLFDAPAQDCLFYDRLNYNGIENSLIIGDEIIVPFDSLFNSPSWKIVNNNAAILFEDLSPTGSYPFILVYSDLSSPGVGGGGSDHWVGTGEVKVACMQRCVEEECLPQPTTWIPIDFTDIFGEPDVLPPDHLILGNKVLMLKKAFIWENSEDVGGIHGPYASISITCRRKEFFDDFTYEQIVNNYCEEYYLGDSISNSLCYQFETNYGEIPNAGVKLPGPAYWAHPFLLPNPKSEWIDGPWGACYSRIPVFDWDNQITNPDNFSEISVHLREGDDSNLDDFLGGQIINKNTTGPILVQCGHFGYMVLQNEIITQEHIDENISGLDVYWNAKWNGSHPEEIVGGHVIIPNSLLPEWNQYLPLAADEIDEMESIFLAESTVGLIGRDFPTGTLDKPMKYSAPCDPATFNNPDYSNSFAFISRNKIDEQFNKRKKLIDKEAEKILTVFPNPSKEEIYVSFKLFSESTVSIKLINSAGAEVNRVYLGNQPQGEFEARLDLRSIEPGTYFLYIQCNDWVQSKAISIW